jgi:hypothetical protein
MRRQLLCPQLLCAKLLCSGSDLLPGSLRLCCSVCQRLLRTGSLRMCRSVCQQLLCSGNLLPGSLRMCCSVCQQLLRSGRLWLCCSGGLLCTGCDLLPRDLLPAASLWRSSARFPRQVPWSVQAGTLLQEEQLLR